MDVSLTPELEQFVQEKIASGNYNCASEVVREALCLLRDQDELRRIRLEELRREVMKGVEAADRGELIPADEIFRELRERHAELLKRQNEPL